MMGDMTMPRWIGLIPNALVAAPLAYALVLAPVQVLAQDHGFEAENNEAMARMMSGMTIKSSGNVDRDFAEMMIAHHQGAIDMARAELRHGGNEQLRRIAQEIIVDQQQEIAAMRLALGDPLPPSAAAPTQPHQHDPAAPASESRR
jgi:hypothetical protein